MKIQIPDAVRRQIEQEIRQDDSRKRSEIAKAAWRQKRDRLEKGGAQ